MKTGVLATSCCLFTIFFAFSAFGGQAVHFDENGNKISASQYEKLAETQNEKKAAQKAMFKKARKAHKEKVRLKREAAKAEAAKAEAVAASKFEQPLPGAGQTGSYSIIDNLIKDQRTGALTPKSAGYPKSNLNTYDYYSRADFFNLSEDMYVFHEYGESVVKKVLVNGVWHDVKKYGPDKYKIGKKRPEIKNIDWSWNNLNKKKTGGYREK